MPARRRGSTPRASRLERLPDRYPRKSHRRRHRLEAEVPILQARRRWISGRHAKEVVLEAWQVWEEQIRNLPIGGRGGSLWVVRREGQEGDAPLRLLLQYVWNGHDNGAEQTGGQRQPPLGKLLRVIQTGETLRHPLADSASSAQQAALPSPSASVCVQGHGESAGSSACLWTEPLRCGTDIVGAFALWFDASPPWGEAMRLWGQRFAARIAPLLQGLPCWAQAPRRCVGPDLGIRQLSLFPPEAPLAQRPAPPRGLPLPRPIFLPDVPGAVGVSREWLACCASLSSIACSGVNVLLYGESGTGKEIIARAIHLASHRRRSRFVGLNCAALPETLFESELFGHKAGSFTGAATDKVGLLEAASGGTFFMDEIGDMPVPLQIKLLRVMQERRVRRVGELQSRQVDIRFLAATHRDLPREIDAGRFRLDLYYRLNVVRLVIPPLRQRPEDITHLLAYFLGRQGHSIAKTRITEDALAALQAYRWPGNVRELENEASRLVALYPGETLIRREQLSPEISATAGCGIDAADLIILRPLGEASELLEQYLIRKAITAAAGRKAAAARRLGLSRQGLYKKIQRYGMIDLVQRTSGHAAEAPS